MHHKIALYGYLLASLLWFYTYFSNQSLVFYGVPLYVFLFVGASGADVLGGRFEREKD